MLTKKKVQINCLSKLKHISLPITSAELIKLERNLN